MLFAEQTAAPALLHSVATSMNLSLITVASMLDLSTQTGTRRETGCWLPLKQDGSGMVPLPSQDGGLAHARTLVASATVSGALMQTALKLERHCNSVSTLTLRTRVL